MAAIKEIKCTNCKGTGRVPTMSGLKKYMTCPICHGTGKKKIIVNIQGGLKNGNY